MKTTLCFLLLSVVAFAADELPKPCVFCGIATGEVVAPVVWRDESVVASMDRAPRNPGHVLIIPVRHADNYLEARPEDLEKMIVLAQRVGRAIKRTDLKADGIQVLMNTGKAAGQSVFHAHLHIIPRFPEELPQKSPGDVVPPEQLGIVAAKIRAALL